MAAIKRKLASGAQRKPRDTTGRDSQGKPVGAAAGPDTVVSRLSFRPTWAQWDILQATKTHDFSWLCGGVGAGKTYILARWMADNALHYYKGLPGLLVEPDFQTFEDSFLPEWEKQVPRSLWELRTSRSGKSLVVYWGDGNESGESEIYIRSAMNSQSVERLLGLNVAWGALDEPSRMRQGLAAWNHLIGRCRLPNPRQHNPILVVGSPRGINWVAHKFGLKKGHPPVAWTHGYEPQPGYYVRATQTIENPAIDASFRDRLAESYGDQYAIQELEGDLVSAHQNIFAGFYASVHVVPHSVAAEIWDRRVRRKVGGIDWGFTSPSALLCNGLTGDKELITIDEWGSTQAKDEETGHHCDRLATLHGIGSWYADTAEPDRIRRLQTGFDYQGRWISVPVIGANKAWLTSINQLRALLHVRRGMDHPAHPVGNSLGCPRWIISDRCTNLIAEMAQYRHKEIREGQAAREGAVGDDHWIDCARYCVMELIGGFEPIGYQAVI